MYAGLALSGLIVARSFAAGWWKVYRLAFLYFLFVLLSSVSMIWILNLVTPASLLYANFYWASDAITLFLGFGTIWQLQHEFQESYPGAARVIRALIMGSVGAILAVWAARLSANWRDFVKNSDEVEIQLRCAQAALLGIVYFVILFYRIRLNRNVQGLLNGFSLYVAVVIASLSLLPKFGGYWRFALPAGYIGSQIIWLTSLWRLESTPSSEPVPPAATLAEDLSAIERLRFHLVRALFS